RRHVLGVRRDRDLDQGLTALRALHAVQLHGRGRAVLRLLAVEVEQRSGDDDEDRRQRVVPARPDGADELPDGHSCALPPPGRPALRVRSCCCSATTPRSRSTNRSRPNVATCAATASSSHDRESASSTASATRSARGASKNTPVTPSATVSRYPPSRSTTLGRPNAPASRGDSP